MSHEKHYNSNIEQLKNVRFIYSIKSGNGVYLPNYLKVLELPDQESLED